MKRTRTRRHHYSEPTKKHYRKHDGAWMRYCPHDDCPHYMGEGVSCDRVGQHCELEAVGQGLPGLHE